jgi:hypothetical protein
VCYATKDVVQFGNSFYYNLISRHFSYFLHCYAFTQLHANLFSLSPVVFTYSVLLYIFTYSHFEICPLTANCLGRSSCLQDKPSTRTPRNNFALLLRCVRTISESESESESCYDRRSVGQSLFVSGAYDEIFFFRSEYGIRLTVTFLIPRDSLSDERTGLSFVCAAGPCQRSLSLS